MSHETDATPSVRAYAPHISSVRYSPEVPRDRRYSPLSEGLRPLTFPQWDLPLRFHETDTTPSMRAYAPSHFLNRGSTVHGHGATRTSFPSNPSCTAEHQMVCDGAEWADTTSQAPLGVHSE
ncbi:hypothetical protein ACOMHN_036369 [Nucella lapillus]